ncbi:hypothetical protein IFM89_015327 [Coptis chinensis]|uniref:Cas1p 10 TM acyl transferase domain-containing protein n=1 Tax=Coptis chinensis TaxID=261450 RepID=A0A835IL18_9MAGN|nr:hypothetical protein IFM89_015327 [Coptis chinensis]
MSMGGWVYGIQGWNPDLKSAFVFLENFRSGLPDGQPKFLLSLIPDYPLLNFMLNTSIYVAVSYRLFELTNTLKTAFVPSKDDKRLAHNIIAAGAISVVLYSLSLVFLQIPRMMSVIDRTVLKLEVCQLLCMEP